MRRLPIGSRNYLGQCFWCGLQFMSQRAAAYQLTELGPLFCSERCADAWRRDHNHRR